ncbi:hypothetical protein RhiirA5_444822 [Rhizophagus irregularis]|uniref:Uncharacterized protein n=1 Tax=Rhizophagus irregularis TaxID=588596 RepID=A0A2N0NCU9_9GLOM|nr:hypothetical protein RhiirA5_444822 [Rhizophagus irregularis]
MIAKQVEILNWINLLMKLILNSKYCDDFIKWIPCSNLDNVKYLINGGNLKLKIHQKCRDPRIISWNNKAPTPW